MVKDEVEIQAMRDAVAATKVGFGRSSPTSPRGGRGRGERWVEGVFGLHARHEGNGIGYDSICASGDHANTLHWIKNTGDIRDGDLLLLDAGVEVDSLFTADITRTLPVNGTFTDAQREIYDAVYAAQQAGIAAVKPGNKFSDIHAAAIRVIAEHLHAWGCCPRASVEDTLDTEHGQYHRRWMVHGTSHHLGIDVHDCALATRVEYMDAELAPGWSSPSSRPLLQGRRPEGPGALPRQRRSDRGRCARDCRWLRNLSAGMPRTADDVEAWIRARSSRADALRRPEREAPEPAPGPPRRPVPSRWRSAPAPGQPASGPSRRRVRAPWQRGGARPGLSYLVATTCWIEVKSRCPPVIA